MFNKKFLKGFAIICSILAAFATLAGLSISATLLPATSAILMFYFSVFCLLPMTGYAIYETCGMY